MESQKRRSALPCGSHLHQSEERRVTTQDYARGLTTLPPSDPLHSPSSMSYFVDLLHGRRKVLHQLGDGLVQVVQVFLLILAGAQGLGCPLGPHQLFVRTS